MDLTQYIKSITHSANTILEGMAVTFSNLFREPITVQYPDKTDRPVTEMLPARYRGFLEVQMDICTGCRRCERNCPIECIAIELVKDPATKKQAMARFDIDLGKCMYCGLCVEACKIESTGAIRHTREFEGAASTLDHLVFRFIPEGLVPLWRAPKDLSEVPVGEYGPHAREARERAMRDNPALLEELRTAWKAQREAEKKGGTVPPEQPAAKSAEAPAKKKATAAAATMEVKTEAPAADGAGSDALATATKASADENAGSATDKVPTPAE